MAKMTKAQKKVGKVTHEFKTGTLHSGKKGPVVKSRKQAIAIALSEAGMGKPRRKYADGGVVDIAAPPVGMTSLSGSTPQAAPQAAPAMSPYSSPADYGMGAQPLAPAPAAQNPALTVRNRTTGATGVVGGPTTGYAKGGLVKKPRGCGKAIKGLTKGRMY